MHHIIYVSRATWQLSPVELINLLVQARQSNEVAGVTGAMVYGKNQFMQILEGEEAAVRALYERIVADPRHQAILKLADKPIAERTFLKWSMACRELAPKEMAALEGYVSPEQWAQMSFAGNPVDAVFLHRMRELVLVLGIPDRRA
jgi:hypothetical protein